MVEVPSLDFIPQNTPAGPQQSEGCHPKKGLIPPPCSDSHIHTCAMSLKTTTGGGGTSCKSLMGFPAVANETQISAYQI